MKEALLLVGRAPWTVPIQGMRVGIANEVEKRKDFYLHACGQAGDPGKASQCALTFYSGLSVGTFLQKGRKWGLGLVAHARNPSTKRLR